ncbi:MAG: hypothetical protein LC637_07780 [Xanthomonadaceae bacterium]|nr:hypothetical protein [Xanthomonadaceae bacterium]
MHDHLETSPRLNAKAALLAGVVAGAAFMMLEMIMVPVFLGGSPWGPPRMIAAIGMGNGVLPPPATFDLGIMVVAMLIHFALSVILAFLFAFLFTFIGKRDAVGLAIGLGAVFGLIVYLISFYGMTEIFPWFAMARHWVSIFAHLVFGAVLGWVYVSVARKSAENMTSVHQDDPDARTARPQR